MGVAYTLSKAKSSGGGGALKPMLVGGAVGTLTDLLYGHAIACVEQADNYQRYKDAQSSAKAN